MCLVAFVTFSALSHIFHDIFIDSHSTHSATCFNLAIINSHTSFFISFFSFFLSFFSFFLSFFLSFSFLLSFSFFLSFFLSLFIYLFIYLFYLFIYLFTYRHMPRTLITAICCGLRIPNEASDRSRISLCMVTDVACWVTGNSVAVVPESVVVLGGVALDLDTDDLRRLCACRLTRMLDSSARRCKYTLAKAFTDTKSKGCE